MFIPPLTIGHPANFDMEGSNGGTEHVVRLVNELYKYASNTAVHWDGDEKFRVSALELAPL